MKPKTLQNRLAHLRPAGSRQTSSVPVQRADSCTARKPTLRKLPVPPSVAVKGAEFVEAFMQEVAQELNKAARPVQQYVNVLIDDARHEVANRKEEIAQLQSERASAELKVKHLTTENRRLNEGKRALRRKVVDAERRLKKEREQRKAPTGGVQLSALQAQVARLNAEQERLQAKVKDLVFQRDQLRHRLLDLVPKGQSADTTLAEDPPKLCDTSLVEPLPDTLAQIGEWAKTHLAGKAVIREKALQEAAKSRYEQPQVVYKALLLLANQYREMRLGLAKHNWAELLAQEQLVDEFSLSETASNKLREGYTFNVDGRSYYMERHLKRGTSRDPRQCLRIYFAWDSERKLVVVGSLPEHLRTRAS